MGFFNDGTDAWQHQEHNGYSTPATWVVGLWIDNDQGAYLEALSMAEMMVDYRAPVSEMAEWLEQFTGEMMAHDSNVFSDVMGRGGLGMVNWGELGQLWLDAAREGMEYTE